MAGYIKLYRDLLNNPVVCKDADHLAIWIYLLCEATHKEHDKLFNGKRITLAPGQLITGRKIISDKLRISQSKTQRVLICLESEHQIERQRGAKSSLISIVNWDKYQEGERQNKRQVNSNRTASEQQVNTLQECKECKEWKEVYRDLPKALIEPFEAYLEMRKKIKKPMTDRAIKMLLTELGKLTSDEKTAVKIIEQATVKCWLSFYPLKDDKRVNFMEVDV